MKNFLTALLAFVIAGSAFAWSPGPRHPGPGPHHPGPRVHHPGPNFGPRHSDPFMGPRGGYGRPNGYHGGHRYGGYGPRRMPGHWR